MSPGTPRTAPLPRRHEGRAALVTGAARGIGRAIARRLLLEGASVVLADVDDAAGHDAVDEYADLGPCRFAHTDVADEESVAAAVATAVAAFGGLDAAVHDAALTDPVSGPVEGLERARWDRVLAVNLTGAFLVAKHAAPHLRARAGALVNLSSTRASMSEANTEAYAASKGGLVALTHALAISLGPEVRVNAISPGWIETSRYAPRPERDAPSLREVDHRQHPAGRVGDPDDVAAAAAYLLSDEAAFVTGHELVIDGGMTRKMIYVE